MLLGASVLAWLAISAAASATSGSATPLRFEPAKTSGNLDTSWIARPPGYAVLLSGGGATVVGDAGRVQMRIVGANAQAPGHGAARLAGRSHHLVGGDRSAWRTDVSAWSRVRFEQVRPGIDIEYYGREGELEFDLVVAVGARPESFELAFEGNDALTVAADGSLLLGLPQAELRLRPPVVYQQRDGAREAVAARYALRAGGHVGFDLGEWDRSRGLVIDPVLSYSTYLGGSDADAMRAVAVDRDGFVYVTGDTLSTDFPLAAPLQGSYGGGSHDAFVAKLAPGGSELVWATYLGGTLHDRGFAIAVDDYGNVFLTGRTGSTDYPTQSALQPVYAGGANDAFVTKLAPSGDAILYSTYLGGSGDDRGLGIAVDRFGEIVVAGFTLSTDLPLQQPIQTSLSGGVDAFVAKLDATGQAFVYSTYIGGSGIDNARGLAVDELGRAIVAGDTQSSDFPVSLDALQATKGGGFDAWFGILDAQGQVLAPASFLGGSGDDFGLALARGPSGDIAIVGSTESTDFPLQGAFQSTQAGAIDAFVTRIDAAGTTLLHSSYLGGAATEFALAAAIDSSGNIAVGGNTSSSDFPTQHAIQAARAGGFDDFVMRVGPDGAIVDSTFLGGSGDDLGFDRLGLAVGPRDTVHFAGRTRSLDYPVEHALQPANGGGFSDASLSRITFGPEVAVGLEDVAGTVQLTLRLRNGATAPVNVELWLWRVLAGASAPTPLASALPLTLGPLPTRDVFTVGIGAAATFPGTTVGARLLDARTGELLSESLCATLPCNR